MGGDLANVNRWRGQIALPPIDEAALASALEHIDTEFAHFDVVDLTGPQQRILGAILTSGGWSWFFKVTGEPAHVGTQREAFLQLLHSVRAPAPTLPAPATGAAAVPPPAPVADTAAASAAPLTWTAPAHWTAKPPSPMRRGSFSVRGDDGREADFSVIAFPGDAGGLLANVNRWRGQVGLEPFGPNELIAAARPLETEAGLRFVIVDLAGPEQRILGGILAHGGESWFFKLMGPTEVVDAERGAFTAFLRSVTAPAAPADAE